MTQAEFYTSNQSIAEGYDSYTILLIPEFGWLGDEEQQESKMDMDKVLQRFHAFGQAIGSKNLSCWFYEATVLEKPMEGCYVHQVISEELTYNQVLQRTRTKYYHVMSSSYDFKRAREYCDKFNLSYNYGPYIVYMERHPDSVDKPNFIIKTNGLSTSQFIVLLNELEQSITTRNKKFRELRLKEIFEYIKALFINGKEDIFKIVELIKN
ncbi:MAG: hypothetical protein GPI92_09035 [Microcystis aeruginosa K13-06]|jgi:hypothetical protein|nr:hypothetical protein [Microcystis aeruginosa K13-06]